MATEYKIENRVLYIYLDGDLDHHLAKKVKHKCDIILKSYPIKDIEFDFKNSGFIDSSGIASTDRRNIEKWEDKKCCI